MSSQALKTALADAGFDNATAARAVDVFLLTIEKQLATNGAVNFKGIGCLEVVPNHLGNTKTPIGGNSAKRLPVRIRFVVSRGLKSKIATAYR